MVGRALPGVPVDVRDGRQLERRISRGLSTRVTAPTPALPHNAARRAWVETPAATAATRGGSTRRSRWAPAAGARRALFAPAKAADLRVPAELLEAGTITAMVDRECSLRELPDAIHHLEQGHALGKLVIAVRSGE
ncbi:zinc-binding dehydrogenase [Nonomuraea sp. B12E4]|uniref:zinc-binding dehydrogenase n=1 Tax=Nonomuraea sp. B12E4 TaxID=3153564 RepID=UPI00325E325C